MDSRQLSRLHEEQERAIEDTKRRIQQCEKFKNDYTALKDRLVTLPDAVKHDIMVPFGKLGMMPGQLVHTNEVLVLLGDNWFVERSAKQACQIADRRIGELDKQLEDLRGQMKLLCPRLDFTSDLQSQIEGDVKEIVEAYDEDKERLWDEQHKENMKKYKRQLREESGWTAESGTGSKKLSAPKSDGDLWSRLDELEKLERGYLDSLGEDSDDDKEDESKANKEFDESTESKSKPQVRWAEDPASRQSSIDSGDETDNEDDDESDDETSEEEEEALRPQRRITFTHTKCLISEQFTPQASASPDSDSLTIHSPADIYKLFCPKSILKKSSSVPDSLLDNKKCSPSMTSQPGNVVSITGDAPQAFTGQILERPTTSTPTNKVETTDGRATSTKRVSRFKAQRMQHSS